MLMCRENSEKNESSSALMKVYISTQTKHLVDYVSHELFTYLCAHR